MARKRIIVAITGASGALYAKRILEALGAPGADGGAGVEVFLVVSTYGRRLLHDELGIEAGGALDVGALVGRGAENVTLLPYKDVGAPIASGSFRTDGMVVVPCSNNKLAELAHGLGDNLISRAANVCLKERRKLVVVHREMPLGMVEIKNMLALTEAGGIVCPANPGFYHVPQTVEEVVDTVAARVLDLLGVEHKVGKRWGEMPVMTTAPVAVALKEERTTPVVAPMEEAPSAKVERKESSALEPVPVEAVEKKAAAPTSQAVAEAVAPAEMILALRARLDASLAPREERLPVRPAAETAAPAEDALDGIKLIEERCRLKAEAARWAAEKQRRPDATHFKLFLEKPLQELVARAKQMPQCFLWMVHRQSPAANAPAELLERTAASFEALGEALGLVREVLAGERAGRQRALELLAEAQACVRAAATACGVESDTDQYEAFEWLREITQREQVQVRRFMRLSDQPEAGREKELLAQILERRKEFAEARRGVKLREAARKQIKYHMGNLLAEPEQSHVHDWRKIGEAVEKLKELGLTDASPELHELLGPVAEHVPSYEALAPGLRSVLEEMERVPEAVATETSAARAYSAEVVRVGRLLRGKSVVLIGGDPRPQAREALLRAFGLGDLIWIKSREHQSTAPFEAPIARPEVALVLLAIRWSGHSFADAKVFCERHGKPLVRLPGGYSPNQVAAQVAQQCSGRLAAGAPALEEQESGA